MKLYNHFALALVLIALCSCKSVNRKDKSYLKWPKDDIETTLKVKPAKQPPYSVGIYFTNDEFWTKVLAEEGSDSFKQFEQKVIDTGFVSYVSHLKGADEKTIEGARLEGARLGVDTVLVLEQEIHYSADVNSLSFFYPTIVGLWFAPGHTIDTQVTLKGSLWDVKTGYLVMNIRGEGADHGTSPATTLEKNIAKSVGKSTKSSVDSLLVDIIDELPKAREKISKFYD